MRKTCCRFYYYYFICCSFAGARRFFSRVRVFFWPVTLQRQQLSATQWPNVPRIKIIKKYYYSTTAPQTCLTSIIPQALCNNWVQGIYFNEIVAANEGALDGLDWNLLLSQICTSCLFWWIYFYYVVDITEIFYSESTFSHQISSIRSKRSEYVIGRWYPHLSW